MNQNKPLKSCINASDKIDEITLALKHNDGMKYIYILVEGVNDCKIYPKFFDESIASVEFVGGGKGQVIIVLQTLSNTGHVIGICDADFRHLEHNYPAMPELFFTDQHDIEMTMIYFDDVLTNALTEYRLQTQMLSIRQNAIQEAEFIGYVRWFNEKNVCLLNFDGLGVGKLLTNNGSAISMNNHKLVAELNTISKSRIVLNTQMIADFIKDNTTTDIHNLCNGHDVVKFIAAIIRITIQVSDKKFASDLRLSFRLDHFHGTKMYSDIFAWQSTKGLSILN